MRPCGLGLPAVVVKMPAILAGHDVESRFGEALPAWDSQAVTSQSDSAGQVHPFKLWFRQSERC